VFVDILGCVDHNNNLNGHDHDYDNLTGSQCDTESDDGSADKSVRFVMRMMSDV
jgi:hypothetical protein